MQDPQGLPPGRSAPRFGLSVIRMRHEIVHILSVPRLEAAKRIKRWHGKCSENIASIENHTALGNMGAQWISHRLDGSEASSVGDCKQDLPANC